MTFQIFVGGQRVNSDFITSTPAWGGQQDKSRKRSCDDDEQEMSCKRQQGAQDANHVLQSMTNCAHFGK